MSGYIFILNGGAICWKSFKQHIMADSICKVEYISISDTVKKVCGYESLSTSSEWHPPSMALSCYTAIVLEPLLKSKSWSSISAPSIFYTATILSERSWIEMTSIFWRLIEKRIRPTHLLKLSKSRSSIITSQRWVYDTVPIGFSPSKSCWKLYPKDNHQSVNDCVHIYKLYIIFY